MSELGEWWCMHMERLGVDSGEKSKVSFVERSRPQVATAALLWRRFFCAPNWRLSPEHSLQSHLKARIPRCHELSHESAPNVINIVQIARKTFFVEAAVFLGGSRPRGAPDEAPR